MPIVLSTTTPTIHCAATFRTTLLDQRLEHHRRSWGRSMSLQKYSTTGFREPRASPPSSERNRVALFTTSSTLYDAHIERAFHRRQDHLRVISHPNAYAGYMEGVAAVGLYNVDINITFSAPPLPPFPMNSNHLHILYEPNSMHHSTLFLLDTLIIDS